MGKVEAVTRALLPASSPQASYPPRAVPPPQAHRRNAGTLEYASEFGQLPTFRADAQRLQMKLYRDRREFRRINPGMGWAEAFYRKPYCQFEEHIGPLKEAQMQWHDHVQQLKPTLAAGKPWIPHSAQEN